MEQNGRSGKALFLALLATFGMVVAVTVVTPVAQAGPVGGGGGLECTIPGGCRGSVEVCANTQGRC